MKKIIKIGIIGLGVGLKHWETYEKNPSCEVVAIADFDKKKLEKYKKKFPKIQFVTDANKVLKNKSIDNRYSAPILLKGIIKSIKNDKHIFIEKPITRNIFRIF